MRNTFFVSAGERGFPIGGGIPPYILDVREPCRGEGCGVNWNEVVEPAAVDECRDAYGVFSVDDLLDKDVIGTGTDAAQGGFRDSCPLLRFVPAV